VLYTEIINVAFAIVEFGAWAEKMNQSVVSADKFCDENKKFKSGILAAPHRRRFCVLVSRWLQLPEGSDSSVWFLFSGFRKDQW
jgi:hypothetical protein